jgi:hypothetical protein
MTGFFDESVQGAEDYELYLRTARQSAFVAHSAAVAEYRLHDSNTSRDAEQMLRVSHRVLEMELPHLAGDPAKLRAYRRGVKFMQRHFGRQLTRELIRRGRLTSGESRRKLALLRHHYKTGFAAVLVSRLVPANLFEKLLHQRANRARQTPSLETYSLG